MKSLFFLIRCITDTMLFYMNQASLPCEGNRVTSPYGIRRYRLHKGIDIKVQKGDTIRAAFTGQVSRVSYERRAMVFMFL
jgi:murein DD-endopeptidase MepM/ murein hydrolase activator NlpD